MTQRDITDNEDAFLARLAFSPQIQPGVRKLPDRYVIEGTLGEGGFGVVYDVYDRRRSRHVALKTIRIESTEMMLRLKSEFRALVHVQHLNIVRLYELEGAGSQSFFTMERIEGAVPFDAWARRGVHALMQALEQMLAGLAALHGHGLVHPYQTVKRAGRPSEWARCSNRLQPGPSNRRRPNNGGRGYCCIHGARTVFRKRSPFAGRGCVRIGSDAFRDIVRASSF